MAKTKHKLCEKSNPRSNFHIGDTSSDFSTKKTRGFIRGSHIGRQRSPPLAMDSSENEGFSTRKNRRLVRGLHIHGMNQDNHEMDSEIHHFGRQRSPSLVNDNSENEDVDFSTKRTIRPTRTLHLHGLPKHKQPNDIHSQLSKQPHLQKCNSLHKERNFEEFHTSIDSEVHSQILKQPQVKKSDYCKKKRSFKERTTKVHGCVSQGSPSLVHADSENEGFCTKNTRGPTRALRVHGLTKDNRIFILLNTRNQPIGPTNEAVNNLSSYLGTLARNALLAPLVYRDWRAIPHSNKIDMLNLVNIKFEIEECAKNWILSTIGTDWRNYKCRLKRNYYYRYKTDADRLKYCPDGVPFKHWKELVTFWSSKEGQVRRIRGMISCKKQQCIHTTGSMSFARVREKEKVKRGNVGDISQAYMYVLTHRNKDGEMDEDTTRILLEYKRQLSLLLEKSEDLDTQNEIFAKLMGNNKAGHVCLHGRGVTSSDLRKKVSSVGPMDAQRVAENARKLLTDGIKEMKDKLEVEVQSKLEQQVQSIKAEMTDQIQMIKVAILQHFNFLMSQMQVRLSKVATLTTDDEPSTSSQMPINESSLNDSHEIGHLVSQQLLDNISLNHICKMVEVNVPQFLFEE